MNEKMEMEPPEKTQPTLETENVPKRNIIMRFLCFFTVEPFLMCYFLPSVFSSTAVQKLNMEKACIKELNYSIEVCANVVAGLDVDNITMTAVDEAQKLVAAMTAWRDPLQSALPAIVILSVGAWSDKTGRRKPLMLMPVIGEFISSLGLIFAVYFFYEWPLWVTGLIEGLPTALTGGFSIALMGSYSYIADVTTEEARTFRIGLVAIIVSLGIPIGTAISGLLTNSVGYYGVFGLNLGFYTVGFLYTYFRIKDVRVTKEEGTWSEKFISFINPKNIWNTLAIVFIKRGRALAQLLLVFLSHVIIIGPLLAEGSLFYLYTLKKFKMNLEDFSYFFSYQVFLGIIGTTVTVWLFSKQLKMHDAVIGMIATTSKVMYNFMFALAPTRSWLYVAPVLDFFGGTGVTAIRSLGTKVVEPDEVGKMCSVIGLLEAVTPVLYTPMYTLLYYNTLDTFTGAIYLLGAFMTMPAFFAFVTLYVLHKKEMKDQVKNPVAKEKYAQDNDITSL